MQAFDYLALDEAIYLFQRIQNQGLSLEKINKGLSDHESSKEVAGFHVHFLHALMRILKVNQLLDISQSGYVMNQDQKKDLSLRFNVLDQGPHVQHFTELYRKALTKDHFFFDHLSPQEADIYSYYNFEHTQTLGQNLSQKMDLKGKRVLEIGGNSGGLATALLSIAAPASYTVIDLEGPCTIGRAIQKNTQAPIDFICGNAFTHDFKNGNFDHVMAMNVLHDFDDDAVFQLMNNVIKQCRKGAKITIIEDVLRCPFEPVNAIMQGARLSLECRGGKQRRVKEFENLFFPLGYKLIKIDPLNDVHTILCFEPIA